MVGLKLRKLVDLIYMYPFFFTLLPFPLFENWFDSKRKDKQMKRYREKRCNEQCVECEAKDLHIIENGKSN